MSSRVKTCIPAGAGATPKRPVTKRAERSSSQTSGFATRESRSIGRASSSAIRSAFASESAFGTSSPSTTLR